MQAVMVHEYGGTDALEVGEADRPEPNPHQLLIEVDAAGINPVDTYFREGSYTPVGLPFTPGVDFAGTVVEAGSHTEGFEPGDAVFGTGIGNGAFQGAYAEYAVVPVDRTVHLPDGVDATQAGAAGVVAATAWRALIEHAGLRPTERCLIHGGAGGVGHAAVQIGRAVNANVTTTAAPAYHDDVASLGANSVLDYDRDDLADAVIETTGGGADVILDHRLDDYLQFDADVAAQNGRIVGIGENDPVVGFSNDGVARSKELCYQFMVLFNSPDLLGALRGVADLMASGDLEIAIHERYGLEDAAEAQRAVMEDSFFGKLVIEP